MFKSWINLGKLASSQGHRPFWKSSLDCGLSVQVNVRPKSKPRSKPIDTFNRVAPLREKVSVPSSSNELYTKASFINELTLSMRMVIQKAQANTRMTKDNVCSFNRTKWPTLKPRYILLDWSCNLKKQNKNSDLRAVITWLRFSDSFRPHTL